jgi:hypothetical protein
MFFQSLGLTLENKVTKQSRNVRIQAWTVEKFKTTHCKDTLQKLLKRIFPEKELRSPSPYLDVHVSVSNLYIPTIGLPILLQENMWTDPGSI